MAWMFSILLYSFPLKLASFNLMYIVEQSYMELTSVSPAKFSTTSQFSLAYRLKQESYIYPSISLLPLQEDKTQRILEGQP
jgi:hypothetical protein